MALHLNLYHETARARQAKRRDPLKLSLYALAAIGAALAGYYFLQLSAMSDLSRELARKKAEYDAIEPEAKKSAGAGGGAGIHNQAQQYTRQPHRGTLLLGSSARADREGGATPGADHPALW
jgi:hypothetical protein